MTSTSHLKTGLEKTNGFLFYFFGFLGFLVFCWFFGFLYKVKNSFKA